MDRGQLLNELHTRLGYKRLHRTWAKLEIVLGLTAAGGGLFLGDWSLARPEPEPPWLTAAAGLALFVLGFYLALAGHRSHLYQSANERLALLIEELRQQRR